MGAGRATVSRHEPHESAATPPQMLRTAGPGATAEGLDPVGYER
jgi:hypothetical protein